MTVDVFAVLSHSGAGSGLSTFRDNLSIQSSKVKQCETLTLADGTDWLSRNYGKNYQPTLRKNPERRRPQLQSGGLS
jgi:hypothetical protein